MRAHGRSLSPKPVVNRGIVLVRLKGRAMPDAIVANAAATAATALSNIRTLAIDIGGTGLKALVLASDGRALTDRVRVPTPRPATPSALLPEIGKLVAPLGAFDRVSI